MIDRVFILLFACFISTNLFADYEEGKKVYEQKCASCHKGYISFTDLKINFYEKDNKLLNLDTPTTNMLAWAIMDSSKQIGNLEDEEMRAIEIEVYLKNYLENPDKMNSICDDTALKYYKNKEPMKITDEEAEVLAHYFMDYKKNLDKTQKNEKIVLHSNHNENEIINKAVKNNKNIIVYATSKFCYFCKKMDKDVLQTKFIKDKMAENYIFLEVDVDKQSLPFGLKKSFKGMTPTFFILTPKAKIKNIYPGAWVKDDYLKILEENL